MKKILAVLNQGQSILNPVPSLDLIEIDSDLATEDQESIEEYLGELYDSDEIQWMILDQPLVRMLPLDKQEWIEMPPLK